MDEEERDNDNENEDPKDKESSITPDEKDKNPDHNSNDNEHAHPHNSTPNCSTTNAVGPSTPYHEISITSEVPPTRLTVYESASTQRFSEITGFELNIENAEQWLNTAIQELPERIIINHIIITDKDLRRLQPTTWINDEVLNAFFRCFEFPSGCWVLSSLLWTMSLQKLRNRQADSMVPREIERNKSQFASSTRIMIPIHDTLSNHWVAVAIDRDTAKITVYDSLAGVRRTDDAQLHHVRKWLTEMYQECNLASPVWSEQTQPSIQGLQTNAFDCGVFAIGNIILHGLTGGADNHLLTQRIIPLIRAEVLRRLLAANRNSSPHIATPAPTPLSLDQTPNQFCNHNALQNIHSPAEGDDECTLENKAFTKGKLEDTRPVTSLLSPADDQSPPTPQLRNAVLLKDLTPDRAQIVDIDEDMDEQQVTLTPVTPPVISNSTLDFSMSMESGFATQICTTPPLGLPSRESTPTDTHTELPSYRSPADDTNVNAMCDSFDKKLSNSFRTTEQDDKLVGTRENPTVTTIQTITSNDSAVEASNSFPVPSTNYPMQDTASPSPMDVDPAPSSLFHPNSCVLDSNSDQVAEHTTVGVPETLSPKNGSSYRKDSTIVENTERHIMLHPMSPSGVIDQDSKSSSKVESIPDTKHSLRRSSRERKPVERSPVIRTTTRHVDRKRGKTPKPIPVTVHRSIVKEMEVSKHYIALQEAMKHPNLRPEMEHPRKAGKTYQVTTYTSDVYFWRTFFMNNEAEEQLERLLYASGGMKVTPNSTAKYPDHDSLLSQPKPPPNEVYPNPFPVKCVEPLTFDEYQNRSGNQLQQILRYRPLVVSNVRKMKSNSRWDSSTLRKLGCIHTMRQVHDKSIIPVMDPNEVIVKTSLNDALISGEKVNSSKPLNFLDIPGYGDFYCDTQLASEVHAYKQTLTHPQLPVPIPEDNIWHLVATKDVFTPLHMDAEGTAVMIMVEVGAKLVFMLVPSSRDTSEAANIHYSLDMDQDMNSTWSSTLTDGQVGNILGWEIQGVLLRPGDMLQTCWALFHSFVMGRNVTNTDHTKNRTSLVRLMAFWHKEFVEHNWQPGSLQDDDSAHMPEWASMTGFIDFLTLSNIFELGPVLWLETYDGEEPDERHITEFDLARSLSRQIFDRYTEIFSIRVLDKVGGHYIHAAHVWEDIRLSFLTQQIICLRRHSQTALQRSFSDTPAPKQITEKIAEHLQSTGSLGEQTWDRFIKTTKNSALIATLFPVSQTCDSYEWTYHSHTENPYTFQLYALDGTIYYDVEWLAIQKELDIAVDLEYSQDRGYEHEGHSDNSSDESSSEGFPEFDLSENGQSEYDQLSERGTEYSFDEDGASVLSLEMLNRARAISDEVATIPENNALNDVATAPSEYLETNDHCPDPERSPSEPEYVSHSTTDSLPDHTNRSIRKRRKTGSRTTNRSKRQKRQ
ncbi:hypothetical protein V5O48_003719 [Marasmius crinis-equi]|uniref:Ubiquitin-like protease family profile domain-containing protein n=1 Tax=Marasmius crinis-equi TaxID=585013 RepID=A0ABR3FS32_9AGAR